MLAQEIHHCIKCGKPTIHYGDKHKFNWIMHFILFILTGFLWLIPFAFYYMSKKDKLINLRCSECMSTQKTEIKEPIKTIENKAKTSIMQKVLMGFGILFIVMIGATVLEVDRAVTNIDNKQENVKDK